MPALVTAADLADYPGAPFAASVVESASESVRDEAGWHIAPEVTETIRVFSEGGTALILPTLKYSVTAVRDVSDAAAPETLTDWTDRGSGILLRSSGWPYRHMLEIDLTHGYTTCPHALIPVVATWAQAIKRGGRVTQESLGSRSVSFAAGDGSTVGDTLARYTIKPGP